MPEELFDVYQFFVDDSHEKVTSDSPLPAEQAVILARNLILSIGGRKGTTKRIIITDGGDSTVFEWIHGKGIVFPKQGGNNGNPG